ncbi:hypothetical protein IJ101_02525 [Candidatus Saccharibacteria bacterium]|nr:hypothetical protein [Candidatus Saccharibacteria bacterium]
MKNKWKELREAQEADIVNDEIEEVEDEIEEVETESNAEVLVEGVRATCETKLRELADFFIGEKPDKEANDLLSTMVSEIKKPEPDHDVFWDAANRLEEKKEEILASKAAAKNAESVAKETVMKAEPVKVEKAEAAAETESAEVEEAKPTEAEAKPEKQPELTKPDVKRSEISKGYKFRHAKADQQYDAEVESILRAIGIAAISGNAVEVLRLAEELAKATGTVSFCTLKANAGKRIILMPQGLENVPNGKKILNFYSGLTSQTASGESRRFATFSREIFEELSGKSADKAEIIKVVVKDKKPSHTPPVLEDYLK